MAVIKQQYLAMDWDEIDDSPDLERVKMALDNLPDESLMRAVGSRRIGRPDAAPVRVKWNCLLVGRALGHRKMSAVLSELRRNSSLRRLVGIHPAKGWRGVPDKDEMSPTESADPDADWGRKTRRWTDKEGNKREEPRNRSASIRAAQRASG